MSLVNQVAQRPLQRQIVRYFVLPEDDFLDLINSGRASINVHVLRDQCGWDFAATFECGLQQDHFSPEFNDAFEAKIEQTQDLVERLIKLAQQTHDSNSW